MKYSLVIHANGPESKDVGIYLTDIDSTFSIAKNWWRVGLVQSLSLDCKVGDIPKLSCDFAGVSVEKTEYPDFSTGLIVFISNFASIIDGVSVPTNGNIIIFKGGPISKDVAEKYDELRTQYPDATPYFSEQLRALGCVQEISLDVSVHQKVKLEITGISSKFFNSDLMNSTLEWMNSLPEWIVVDKNEIDFLQEIGTDGVIDSINENEPPELNDNVTRKTTTFEANE